MRYLLAIFLFYGCSSKVITPATSIHDTVYIEAPAPSTASILRDTIYLSNSCDKLQSLIKRKNDSLFIERFKVERVRYYARIVQKNSTQSKFLLGWVLRAIKD